MGTGGSRYGAGRPAWHVKAEHCRSIDVRRWQREGLLKQGRAGLWAWFDAETREQVASISYQSGDRELTLIYSMNGEPMRQRVPIQRTACNYGGTRSWFACPHCGRRVAKLFLRSDAGFICRRCGRISYASQSDDAMGRAWRRQHKVEARLDEHRQRPKGMHSATYEKLLEVIDECEAQRDRALIAYMSAHFPQGFTL